MGQGIDKNLKGWGLEKHLRIKQDSDLNGTGFSETLKFSCCSDVIIEGRSHEDKTNIWSGYEDCLDIVRGCNYKIKNFVFHCTGFQGATIKSSARDILFENVNFKGNPKNGYVVLGQYSDYDIIDRPKTKRIIFRNCTFEKPDCGIRLWNAEDVRFEGPSCKIHKTHPLIVWGYFMFRRIQDRIEFGKYGRCRDKDNLYRKCCDDEN